ncbi:MAG TPA: methyltransferase domain-containing protein [Ktedonobacterales bacterium]
MTADANYQVWERELPSEVAFWHYWLNDPDIPWKEERAARLAADTPLQPWARDLLAAPPGGTVHLLDVGAGPATRLGTVWPERTVRITAVDPLADEYNELLDAARIIPPVRTRLGHGERLTERFAPDTFDLAVAINALDHSYSPLRVIQGMVEVVKPGAWVWLTHYVNEAEQEHYEGLHQWNFCLEDEQFVIWNKHDRFVVAQHLPPGTEVSSWVTFGRVEKGGLRVQIRKRGADEV